MATLMVPIWSGGYAASGSKLEGFKKMCKNYYFFLHSEIRSIYFERIKRDIFLLLFSQRERATRISFLSLFFCRTIDINSP